MKTLKIIDCVGQGIVITAGISYMLVHGLGNFFVLYMVIGPWQLVSMFIHLVAGGYYVSYIRKLYHQLLVFTVGSGVICLIIGGQVLLIWMTFLVFVSAVLGIMYFAASIAELKQLLKEPVNLETKEVQY